MASQQQTLRERIKAFDDERLKMRQMERQKRQEEEDAKFYAKQQERIAKQKADHAAYVESCGGEAAYAEMVRKAEDEIFERHKKKHEEMDRISSEIREIVADLKPGGKIRKQIERNMAEEKLRMLQEKRAKLRMTRVD